MQTQKSIILTFGNKEELDFLLRQGWVVKHSCPMPSSGFNVYATCLVILEKP